MGGVVRAQVNGKASTGRLANFELLRLLAMVMVVALHYLSKGGVLPDFKSPVSGNGYLACLLEAFSIVAVNGFVLLTGYFCVEGEWKTGRLLQLVLQVLFYTVSVPLVLIATGIVKAGDYGLYQLINDFLPIQMEHYWFMTSYILLYCCIPFLNAGIRSMTRKQLKAVTLLLLLVFSLPKTVLPVAVTIDNKGYDFVWFICVYFVASYIRLYGIHFYSSGRKSLLAYLATVLLMFAYTLGSGLVFQTLGRGQEQVLKVFHYNNLLNLAAAVSFFYFFYHIRIKSVTAAGFICRLSPYALGVYLLHEQMDLRYLWTSWFRVQEYGQSGFFLLHFMATIFCVFVAGICVDYLRSLIFRGVLLFYGRTVKNDIMGRQIKKLDAVLNGRS